jgi:hypothetical protein
MGKEGAMNKVFSWLFSKVEALFDFSFIVFGILLLIQGSYIESFLCIIIARMGMKGEVEQSIDNHLRVSGILLAAIAKKLGAVKRVEGRDE